MSDFQSERHEFESRTVLHDLRELAIIYVSLCEGNVTEMKGVILCLRMENAQNSLDHYLDA